LLFYLYREKMSFTVEPRKIRHGLYDLDMLVVSDIFEVSGGVQDTVEVVKSIRGGIKL